MRELRDAGLRMALLTNNVREWEPRWRPMLPEIDEIFEVVVDSAFVGMRKPEPEIYLLTVERLGRWRRALRLRVRGRHRDQLRRGARAGHGGGGVRDHRRRTGADRVHATLNGSGGWEARSRRPFDAYPLPRLAPCPDRVPGAVRAGGGRAADEDLPRRADQGRAVRGEAEQPQPRHTHPGGERLHHRDGHGRGGRQRQAGADQPADAAPHRLPQPRPEGRREARRHLQPVHRARLPQRSCRGPPSDSRARARSASGCDACPGLRLPDQGEGPVGA